MEEQIGTQPDAVAGAIAGVGVTDGGCGTNGAETEENPGDVLDPDTLLTTRQMQLVEALVCNANIQEACKAAEVGRTAAHRWLQQPAFQKELARRRDFALSEALAGVQSQAGRAAAKLATLLEAEDGRLCRMVCNDILNQAIKMRDTEEFARRLHSLEEKIEQLQKEKTA